MNFSTAQFIVLTLTTTLLVLVIVSVNRSRSAARGMASGFYWLSLTLSLGTLVATILSISRVLRLHGATLLLFQVLLYRAWIVIGVSVATALILLCDSSGILQSRLNRSVAWAFASSAVVLKGICLTVSLSYFNFEIGKLANDQTMREFFLSSGYSIWFMYLVMTLEILGALALFIARAIVPAAFGLAVIMAGALFTHIHNRDPFTDSLDAFHMFILLVCIIVIKLLHSRGVGGTHAAAAHACSISKT